LDTGRAEHRCLASRRSEATEIVVVPHAEHDLRLPDGSLAGDYKRILVDWLRRQAR
jgi:hypothetical protein